MIVGSAPRRPISVLVVDDSPLIREILTKTLVADGDIAIAGVAEDAAAARDLIRTLSPDVVTLDIEMPGLNGLAFLARLMRLRPVPVVMVSTLTTRGAGETLLALELGAVDFSAKPGPELAGDLAQWGAALRDKIRAAAQSDVRSRAARSTAPHAPLSSAAGPAGSVVAIGASTGGVDAIRMVVAELPADCPPLAIVQHMPAGFTARFAARLDGAGAVRVQEAVDGLPMLPGHGYLAPGDRHLLVMREGGRLVCRLTDGAAVSGHRPSVDVLFSSVAVAAGPLGVGVILTGMGRDGTAGLSRVRAAGGYSIGQSEGSALVYGMPRAAYEAGAVAEQAPLEAVAGRIVAAVTGRETKTRASG